MQFKELSSTQTGESPAAIRNGCSVLVPSNSGGYPLQRSPEPSPTSKQFSIKPLHLLASAFTVALGVWLVPDAQAENSEAHAKLVAAFSDAVEFIKKNPRQAAVWFGETLRQDPAIVERIAAENPLLSPGQAASIEPSPELKAFGKQRAEDLFEFGITKTKVEYLFK